jgi:hypothetical protein
VRPLGAAVRLNLLQFSYPALFSDTLEAARDARLFTLGLAAFCAGSVGLAAANSTGGLGRGIGGGSDKAALPLGLRGRRILGPGARSECLASVGDWCS